MKKQIKIDEFQQAKKKKTEPKLQEITKMTCKSNALTLQLGEKLIKKDSCLALPVISSAYLQLETMPTTY